MAAKPGAAAVKPPAPSAQPEVKKQPTAAPAKAAEPARQSRNLRAGAPTTTTAGGAASGSAAGGMDGALLGAMEDILEKLKILDYETKFCADRDLRPISRVYFAMSSKSSEQWSYFNSLCAWLFKELNADLIPWQDEEAPNLVAQTILEVLQKMGFSDASVTLNKLALGWGDGACAVLNFLCDRLLAARKWKVQPPSYAAASAAAGQNEDAAVDEQNDVKDDNDVVEEDDQAGTADDGDGFDNKEPDNRDISHEALVSSVNPHDWKLELERVGPRLKFKQSAAAAGAKEWRTHLEQSVKHDKALGDGFAETKATLLRIGAALKKAVERISAKEKHINREFDHLGTDFREKQKRLDALQSDCNRVNKTVQELTNELQAKVEAYEAIKSELTGKSNAMGDLSPLKRLQTALAALKKETAAMELRIGIVAQTLMQAKLKATHGQAGAAIGAGAGIKGADDDDDD